MTVPRMERALRHSLPHQHGAWSMLLAGLVLGTASVARSVGPEPFVLLAAVVSGFLARHALAALIRGAHPRELKAALGALATFYLAVLLSSTMLLVTVFALPHLLFLAPPLLALVAIYVYLERGGGSRSLPGEIVGALALSLVVPAANYSTTGDLRLAAGPWLLAAL